MKIQLFAKLVAVTTAVIINTHGHSQIEQPEPNVEIAKRWWPAQRNVWTPLGWKDHAFRFNVLYNGTILVAPMGGYDRTYLKPYAADNMQLTFTPGIDATVPPLPKVPTKVYTMDGGIGVQS